MLDKPVACLGILVADIIGWPVNAFPDAGRLVLVEEMGLFTGGCALNAATDLAKIGIPVNLIGKIGLDSFGDFILKEVACLGIDSAGIKRDPAVGTSATMVLVDPNGERRFIHYIGANARLSLQDIDLELVRSSSILLIAGTLVLPGIDGEPAAELLKYAQSTGVITCLDTVWDDSGRWMKQLAPCLPFVDYFMPSLVEAQALTGLKNPVDVGAALLDLGINTVALKMGEMGCLVMTASGDQIRLPAFDVEVIDATGAGDAFSAGFITGLWMDWPIEQTVRFANAVGGLCVTEHGASSGIRSLAETIAFMNSATQTQVGGVL